MLDAIETQSGRLAYAPRERVVLSRLARDRTKNYALALRDIATAESCSRGNPPSPTARPHCFTFDVGLATHADRPNVLAHFAPGTRYRGETTLERTGAVPSSRIALARR